ncbi:F-box domain cyclin-containing protein [Lasiodiplodia theobromae]|uniref:Uncharacterized protein n=1 Tax=Lasiodiplodia theobromae TaxID=45133 RepID=A0A5N5DRD7_9PEZI|nr:F-box domain cyclin-containing protein [Lasiodiplodia theobromae]KAB2580516.1 hypothetical protein DBV05_g731 [Lasiodiplodia theobromae]KAF4541107.1 F-box domain cyclin-containing protein [Lasiodiplodia theobromae]
MRKQPFLFSTPNGDVCDSGTAVALILAHLSNLVSLSFKVPEYSQHNQSTTYLTALGAVLRQSVLPSPPSASSSPFTRFQNLNSATITLPTWEKDTSQTQHHHLTDILAILYAPNLKTFDFTFQSPPDDALVPDWPHPSHHPPRAANLAVLRLHCTRTPSTFLAHLLSCTPALRTFELEATLPLLLSTPRRGDVACSDDDGTRFHGGILATALARHCTKLRSFRVSVRTTEPPLYLAEPVLPSRTVIATPLLLLDNNSCCDVSREEEDGGTRDDDDDDDDDYETGLASMRGLRVLNVAMPVLLGWWPNAAAREEGLARVLPSGLWELWLREDMSWWQDYAWHAVHVVRAIEALLESGRARELVKIVIVMRGAKGGQGWWSEESMELLVKFCAAKGMVAEFRERDAVEA